MSEIENLQGTWHFRTLEIDGEEIPEAAFEDARIVISGDAFQTVTDEATYSGVVSVATSGDFNTIDLRFEEGPEKGNSSLGIFELSGERLTICVGFAGIERPVEFTTTKGSGHALETLERVVD